MRPFASSKSCMLGMLFSTLITRRFSQNPLSIVTACTGIFFNFAYGDLVRFSMPWSFQEGWSRSTGAADCWPNPRSRPPSPRAPAKNPSVGRNNAAAPADTAEVTNRRRERSFFLFMPVSPNNFHQTSLQEVWMSAVAKPSFIPNRSRHAPTAEYMRCEVNVCSLFFAADHIDPAALTLPQYRRPCAG